MLHSFPSPPYQNSRQKDLPVDIHIIQNGGKYTSMYVYQRHALLPVAQETVTADICKTVTAVRWCPSTVTTRRVCRISLMHTPPSFRQT